MDKQNGNNKAKEHWQVLGTKDYLIYLMWRCLYNSYISLYFITYVITLPCRFITSLVDDMPDCLQASKSYSRIIHKFIIHYHPDRNKNIKIKI